MKLRPTPIKFEMLCVWMQICQCFFQPHTKNNSWLNILFQCLYVLWQRWQFGTWRLCKVYLVLFTLSRLFSASYFKLTLNSWNDNFYTQKNVFKIIFFSPFLCDLSWDEVFQNKSTISFKFLFVLFSSWTVKVKQRKEKKLFNIFRYDWFSRTD